MTNATSRPAAHASERSVARLIGRNICALRAMGSTWNLGHCWCIGMALVACAISPRAQAQPAQPDVWQTYVDQQYGTRVEYPSRFSVSEGEPTLGSGQRLLTADRRAELQIYTLPNTDHYTPRTYLAAKMRLNPSQLNYERVTSRFFAISADADDQIHYARCNFSEVAGGAIHCIYLAYPRSEEREWDQVVTRVSLSLRP
jgi:hypothetical protein